MASTPAAGLDQLVATMLAKNASTATGATATTTTTTTSASSATGKAAKRAQQQQQQAAKGEKVSILRAARDGDVNAINEAIRKGNSTGEETSVVEIEGMFGARPIHLAAAAGGPAAVSVLLGAGANPLSKMKDGRNALHCAAAEGRHDTLSLLLPVADKTITSLLATTSTKLTKTAETTTDDSEDKSKYEEQSSSPHSTPESPLISWLCDKSNNTPLHLAVLSGKLESVELLLASSIQREGLSIANSDGKKPADLAYLKPITNLINKYESSAIENEKVEQHQDTKDTTSTSPSSSILPKQSADRKPQRKIATSKVEKKHKDYEDVGIRVEEGEDDYASSDRDADMMNLHKKMDLLMWSMQEIRRENAELKKMMRLLLQDKGR